MPAKMTTPDPIRLSDAIWRASDITAWIAAQPDAALGAAGDTPQLLTVRETARQLGVSPAVVRRGVRLGVIRAVRLGPRTVRVRPVAVDRWLGE